MIRKKEGRKEGRVKEREGGRGARREKGRKERREEGKVGKEEMHGVTEICIETKCNFYTVKNRCWRERWTSK